ncbi:hypothetical protein MMC32_003635 [Xylographa parallela]|nr:hypothetical protein [Xylographa parallela]
MRTSAVLSLRYLASKIHPPLSLNPRDSEKLFKLLSTSFRAQLDQEHGRIGSSKTSAAEVHIQSVLDNPLFSVPPHSGFQSKYGGLQKSWHDSARNTEGAQGLPRNAVEHFEEHVRSGTASINLAKLCLETCLKSFRDVSARRIDLKLSSKVGVLMLQWLWSSGLERNLNFLRDPKFVAAIVPFLVVDGRDRHVYNWLLRLRSELTGTSLSILEDDLIRENFRMQSNLVCNLILSEINYGSGLNAAIREFLENVDSANEWVDTFPDLRKARPSTFDARRILQRAGKYIVRRLVFLQTTSGIDVTGYEKLIRSTESWSLKDSFVRAQLALLHPVAPDPLLFLQYIREEMGNAVHRYPPAQTSQVIKLCLDTSNLLLSQGQHVDAQWVLHFLQETFPHKIGHLEQNLEPEASGRHRESTTTKTESGLRELEALAFV